MEIHWESMFGEKSSSPAPGSPEQISRSELCQPEHMERNLGLFFWKGDVMKDYILDGASRGATILSWKLFFTNLVKETLL